jgi:hypothetical protein
MLHWSPAAPINWFGKSHISAFSAVDILRAAIVLRSTIAGLAAAQVKDARRNDEQGARLSLAQS